jgi:hypothetical protein
MLGDIARGCDPKTGKRFNTMKDVSLREELQKFLEVNRLWCHEPLPRPRPES